MNITAAVVREKGGPFSIEQLQLDDPKDDEVLISVVGAGVCHTDLVCRDQYYPVPLPCVFGHEGSGVVEKVGARVKKVQPGDHVVLSYLSCGSCSPCQGGHIGYCHNLYGANFIGTRMDGSHTLRKGSEVIFGAFFNQSSFASHALATERNVVKVRKDVPLEILGPLGCGVQTGAGGVINALHPYAGTSIAVFGTGSVGISAVMGAVVCGCSTIIAVDILDARLELAKQFGATHTINAAGTDPVKAIQDITGTGAQYSLDMTGNPTATRQAIDCLTTTGTCGLIGAAPLGTETKVDMNSILFGRNLRGIIEGDSIPDIFIPRLIDLYMQGRFPFDKMIKFYSLNDIQKAADDSEKGLTLKAVVRP